MRILFVLLIAGSLNGLVLAQEPQNSRARSETALDVGSSVRRDEAPRIGLNRALKIARSYLRRQRISISGYHLVRATYTSMDIESNRVPCWRLLWTKITSQPSNGGDLEAYVFMNGSVSSSKQ